MKRSIVFAFGIFMLSASIVSAQEKPDAKTLKCIVEYYHTLKTKIYQTDSTQKDIDKVFELFSEDLTYVHPKYGGTYSREVLYNGYVNNLKKGRYNGRVQKIRINKIIVGLDAVVVETQDVLKDPETGKVKLDLEHMTLFEFEGMKIKKIYEYW